MKKKIHLSLLFSILLWSALTDAWGYSSFLFRGMGNGWSQYIYGFLSRSLWVMPFVVLAMRKGESIQFPARQLFGLHVHWPSFLGVLAASVLCVIVGMYLNHGGLWINPEIRLSQELPKYIVVGFVEEMVYRGWGMNAFGAYMSSQRANVLASLYFALLHFPAYLVGWYVNGVFSPSAMLGQAASVFVLGLVFGYVLQKSRSIWPPAFLHFWYDLTFVFLIG